jgi:hypothetical protein
MLFINFSRAISAEGWDGGRRWTIWEEGGVVIVRVAAVVADMGDIGPDVEDDERVGEAGGRVSLEPYKGVGGEDLYTSEPLLKLKLPTNIPLERLRLARKEDE